MNVNLNKQGILSSNIFIENSVINSIIDSESYEILVDSEGLTIVDSSGESIYLIHPQDGIPIEEILDYLNGLTTVNDKILSGNIALRLSDDYIVTNEFIEI